ncbi:MAG: dihydrouridine synthase [Bdellovibrionales bacterium RIFCSPHIGHO2_01_FULL_40_29]|nr:MAG: dihydrouridine synthase [Bdellovibrionales bacterium RIFCSPHIGHO2_01_FULL_40_29]OFZ32494.1 MAG: dihydrouridine synthase [Bdellovibrionales bacterium RIFCSPHIGHO2_02_FULL_40_15]
MEGVTDWVMRDLLTSLGGIDFCVTEFLRVTDQLLPDSVFEKNCPELKTGSRTRAGTPVFIQLLGGQVAPLAENAARAVELGALGIDLNFGCPAKTVNRHDGGASLLKSTDRIFNIVSAVRTKVPPHIPVTAKIRLGFDHPEACLENAKAITAAGASWLTVHCRTKTDGYKPPAFWEWIPKIRAVTPIEIVTNGEIWNTADFQKCHSIAQTNNYMIGRGAIRDPFIFTKIKNALNPNLEPNEKIPGHLILNFYQASCLHVNDHFAVTRTKGWLKQLSFVQPHIKDMFDEIKILEKPTDFRRHLESYFTN